MSPVRTAVSVDELQRAWAAVQEGQFRRQHPAAPAPSPDTWAWSSAVPASSASANSAPASSVPARWVPTGRTVVVAGAAGRVGASTVALAIATAAQMPARVVECCSPHASSFAAAASAELGVDDNGWRHGTRGQVVIERTTTAVDHPNQIPVPSPTSTALTVIDTSWNLGQLTTDRAWVREVLDTVPLVLVTVATVPGMRALNVAMHLVDRHAPIVCAVVGPRRKKWPRQVVAAMSPTVAATDAAGRLVTVDEHHQLAVAGLTPEPLPPDLVTVGRSLLDLAVQSNAGGLEDDDLKDSAAEHHREAEYQRREAS